MAKKLTSKELEEFEIQLRGMLGILSGDIEKLEQDALGASNVPASTKGEDGGEAYAQEFSLELLEHDENAMRELMAAIDRLRDGSFGRCEMCDKWILKTRLRAVPYARNCIDCQRAQENGAFGAY